MNEITYVRQATLSDVDGIMDVIIQAKKYLAANNVDQWQDGFPEKCDIIDDIENKAVSYVIVCKDEIAGFMCVSLDIEPPYENPLSGSYKYGGRYGTIHRTAISDKFRGLGLGHMMFNACESFILSNGIAVSRVDTHEDNKVMRHIAEREGYEQCTVVRIENGTLRIVYEKRLKQ